MKIRKIRSKMLFGDFYPRAESPLPEGAKFLAGAAAVHWLPTILFCQAVGEYSPLVLVAASEALGVLWGLLMLKEPPRDSVSCVPVNHVPHVAQARHYRPTTKAA